MHNTDNVGDFIHDQCDMIVHMPFLEECASKAGVIVEIGVGHGNGSTRAFARGLERSEFSPLPYPGKLHILVDWDLERPQVKPMNSFWHEVHGPSEDIRTVQAVAEILDGRKADIIFIDTIHTYEQMELELPLWSALAGPDTLWIAHDTWMFQVWNHMSVAIQEFARANGWEFVDYDQASHGLGLMRKPDGKWKDIQPKPRILLVPQV